MADIRNKPSIIWWTSLDYSVKCELSNKHYGEKRIMGSLTQNEVEYIYGKEKDNSFESIDQNLYTLQNPLILDGKEVITGMHGMALTYAKGEFTSKQVTEELYQSLMEMWATFNSTKCTQAGKETIDKAQYVLDKYAKK